MEEDGISSRFLPNFRRDTVNNPENRRIYLSPLLPLRAVPVAVGSSKISAEATAFRFQLFTAFRAFAFEASLFLGQSRSRVKPGGSSRGHGPLRPEMESMEIVST